MQSYSKKVSMTVIKRLPRYYQYLKDLSDRDVEKISSKELAELMGLTASQIRQDLSRRRALPDKPEFVIFTV